MARFEQFTNLNQGPFGARSPLKKSLLGEVFAHLVCAESP